MGPPRDRGRGDRPAAHLAVRGHPGVGVRRLHGRRGRRLHPRQRRRARASPGRRDRARRSPSPAPRSRTRRSATTPRATSSATAPRAPGSFARSHPTRPSRACESSAPTNRGSGQIVAAGLRWAIEQGYTVVNLSLSTSKRQLAGLLHELSDNAYFRRATLVASAHNRAVESFPWRFSSVISVGSHELDDPLALLLQPEAAGRVLRAGRGSRGGLARRRDREVLGNSFATAHISGICALILAKHPELTPFELKSVLYLIADNVAAEASDA